MDLNFGPISIETYPTITSHNNKSGPWPKVTNIRVHAIVRECGDGQTERHTDTQMFMANIYFASAIPHAKCNNKVHLYSAN